MGLLSLIVIRGCWCSLWLCHFITKAEIHTIKNVQNPCFLRIISIFSNVNFCMPIFLQYLLISWFWLVSSNSFYILRLLTKCHPLKLTLRILLARQYCIIIKIIIKRKRPKIISYLVSFDFLLNKKLKGKKQYKEVNFQKISNCSSNSSACPIDTWNTSKSSWDLCFSNGTLLSLVRPLQS